MAYNSLYMSNNIRSYRDLIAWQKAFDLCLRVYSATETFPPEECFCLTQQIRRSAISAPSNVAEGAGRSKPGEFIQSLDYARGSVFEMETQLEIAAARGYTDRTTADTIFALSDETSRLIMGLVKSIRSDRMR